MGYGPYKRSGRPGAYPDGMPVALEYEGDEYPTLVGVILATFSAIERELPIIVARMTGVADVRDAIALCAPIRAFGGRVDMLAALLRLREPTSHDAVIYSHCKGLFSQAQTIRNRYAHALFSRGSSGMNISPFHNDNSAKWEPLPLAAIKADKKRMAVILGELFAILHQKELPPKLYGKLLPQDR